MILKALSLQPTQQALQVRSGLQAQGGAGREGGAGGMSGRKSPGPSRKWRLVTEQATARESWSSRTGASRKTRSLGVHCPLERPPSRPSLLAWAGHTPAACKPHPKQQTQAVAKHNTHLGPAIRQLQVTRSWPCGTPALGPRRQTVADLQQEGCDEQREGRHACSEGVAGGRVEGLVSAVGECIVPTVLWAAPQPDVCLASARTDGHGACRSNRLLSRPAQQPAAALAHVLSNTRCWPTQPTTIEASRAAPAKSRTHE